MQETIYKRRAFLKNCLLTSCSLSLFKKSSLLFANSNIDKNIFLSSPPQDNIKELSTLNDRPLNAETPVHLLDEEITPTHRLFVRNNGIIPPLAYTNASATWKLNIDGEIKKNLSFSIKDLLTRFKLHSLSLVLECGGNGRAGYYPPTPGNQWTYGAAGCPLWHGFLLKDILTYAGIKNSAKFVAYYSHDIHLSGIADKTVISRGVPIQKALEDTTLIAIGMNNKPLTALHGYPARLVCPGYPASASGKWLKRLWIRDRVHDGEKMTGSAYRLPSQSVAPGQQPPKEAQWKIIEKMPVKSIITYPKSNTKIKSNSNKKGTVKIRGFAWTGEKEITAVYVSFNFGQTWQKASLHKARNPFAWQRWQIELSLAQGYYEIWARAQDDSNKMQPMVTPGWNPKGYVNNAMPRIALNVI